MRYLPWYFCSSPMLPCSACILLCGAGAGSSPGGAGGPDGETLPAPEPRLRAFPDFLAVADMHIFTADELLKLRFFPELRDEV